jgi:ferritin
MRPPADYETGKSQFKGERASWMPFSTFSTLSTRLAASTTLSPLTPFSPEEECMKEEVRAAVNLQINREFFASYLYLAMAAHFADEALDGFAHWMRLQAKEELGHGMRLFQYLIDRRARVELKAIEAPPDKFGTPLSIAQQALEHERKVSEHIDNIYKLAANQGDFATQVQL